MLPPMLVHVLDEHNAELKKRENTDEDIDLTDSGINDFDQEEEDDDPGWHIWILTVKGEWISICWFQLNGYNQFFRRAWLY